MPVKAEAVTGEDDHISSVEAAMTVLSGLEAAVRDLRGADEYGHTKKQKTRFHASEHFLGMAGKTIEDGLYDIRNAQGYVEGVDIRQHKDGKIAAARITRVLPESVLDKAFFCAAVPYKADRDTVRVQVNYHGDEIGPRVILDAWKTPTTKLAELLVPGQRDMDAYNELHGNLFSRHTAAGIPVAAEAVQHCVLGRPDELVTPAESSWITNIMDGFSQTVQNEIAHNKELTAARASGRSQY